MRIYWRSCRQKILTTQSTRVARDIATVERTVGYRHCRPTAHLNQLLTTMLQLAELLSLLATGLNLLCTSPTYSQTRHCHNWQMHKCSSADLTHLVGNSIRDRVSSWHNSANLLIDCYGSRLDTMMMSGQHNNSAHF